MAFKTHRLRDAICVALAIGTTALVASGGAFAQDAEAGSTTDAKNLDRVLVTGSRIRQVDAETRQPVQIIDRAEIERQGFQSVADILQNVAAAGTPPLSRAQPLSAGEAAGGTYISLRNLGAQRTLVLLNGKRLGISTGGLADVSTIPAIAVERIEVLKDGASSIYGSDAIGGVVNIITRSNFEGATASTYFGEYGEGDGAITKGDFVMGFKGDRGSLTVAAEWAKEEGVKASARPYSAFPRSDLHPTDNWTTVGQVGGFVSVPAHGFPNVVYPPATTANPTRSTRVVLRDGGNPRNPADWINQDTNIGACTAAGCTPGSPLHKSNTNEQTDLHTPSERRGLYVDGVYDITDNVSFRANLLYNKRDTTRTVAGYPMQASFSNPAIPLSAQSYFNPIGADVTNWWRRTWEVPRVSGSELTTYRFSGAFDGAFDMFGRTFDWSVSYLHNESDLLQTAYGNLNVPRVRQALGPSFLNSNGVVQCGTAAAPIPLATCVPWNPFAPFGSTAPGSLTNNRALQDFFFQTEHSTGTTRTTVMTADLAGALFELPAGPLQFAIGVENRKEEGGFTPDALSVTGSSTNLGASPTRGSYSVDEAYGELSIPVLSDLPFARELTLELASRYSDYDTFGDTTNDKIGLKWRPFDSLLFRATVADGFRAPTISDLYGGGSQTFATFSDPCDTVFGPSSNPSSATRANCVAAMGALGNTFRQLGQGLVPITTPSAQTPVPFTQGSNPLLQPETSKSQNIGFVYSPEYLDGFNIAVDWWKIRIADTIVQDSPAFILNDCYNLGIQSRCGAPLFTRDPTLGYITSMTYGNRNAGFTKVEGYDVDFSYRLSTDSWGSFAFNSSNTYTSKSYFVSTNDVVIPLSSVGIGSNFRIRSNTGITWEMGAFGVTWGARYYSSIKENCTYTSPSALTPNLECNHIGFEPNGRVTGQTSTLVRRNVTGSNTFNDIQVRYTAPWNGTIAIGANNVFDRQGQVLYSQPSANVSYYGGFDIGRFLYMKYTQKF